MQTYRFVANLILDTIKKNNDDSDININHLVYWINVVGARLKYQRLNSTMSSTGVYLQEIEDVEVKNSGNKKYIELPFDIVDIDKDGGIEYITYCNEGCDNPIVLFERTTPSALVNLNAIPQTKPSPAFPFFYRAKNNLILLGIECIDVESVCIGIHTSISIKDFCDLDSSIDLDSSQIELLIPRVMNLLRFGLIIEKDRKNDGSDTSSNQRNTTAVSTMTEQPNEQPA